MAFNTSVVSQQPLKYAAFHVFSRECHIPELIHISHSISYDNKSIHVTTLKVINKWAIAHTAKIIMLH